MLFLIKTEYNNTIITTIFINKYISLYANIHCDIDEVNLMSHK